MRRAARGAAFVAAVSAVCALASGCGIRGTAVPVDAGSAPSRATCLVRPGTATATPRNGTALPVQLLCASQLVAVVRPVAAPGRGGALGVAQVLLDELRRPLSSAEESAGFSSEVPQHLTVAGGRRDDPPGTLRLSTAPDALSTKALSQIVCTFAGTAAAGGRDTVLLGGPGGEAPRAYPCTDETRAHPESAPGA
ncbi:lipoprotein [Streptomyces thioluteus]|uniref:Lipoprotein n=1 Tax=Streptomyces thioluteus TaxID=66431 RepID=A0ABN3WIR9_STRTU